MAGGKRDTYPPRRDKMTEHIFLAGRFTTIVNRPAIFMSGDILAKHRAPRYAYIIQTNGGKIHEITFENTIRPHHRGARCRDLVLCLPSQPVLAVVGFASCACETAIHTGDGAARRPDRRTAYHALRALFLGVQCFPKRLYQLAPIVVLIILRRQRIFQWRSVSTSVIPPPFRLQRISDSGCWAFLVLSCGAARFQAAVSNIPC